MMCHRAEVADVQWTSNEERYPGIEVRNLNSVTLLHVFKHRRHLILREVKWVPVRLRNRCTSKASRVNWPLASLPTGESGCLRISEQPRGYDVANTIDMDRIRSTTGAVFNVMKYSTHDGPGIRTTVFLKGCPLRCRWCHNPEGQSAELELFLRSDRCIGCGDCSKACRYDAIRFRGSPLTLRDKCRVCDKCVKVCPSGAREISGRKVTVSEIMEEIEKDVVFYDESGGGVTFSGGEPLMQPDFLQALLRLCRQRKIHTAVETCGLSRPESLLSVAIFVDLFLYDVKIIESDRHEKFTGLSNRAILENLSTLSDHHAHIVIRFPLIPGVNDDERNLSQAGRFISSLAKVQEIQVLPYHHAGIGKYIGLGRSYELAQIKPPSSEQISKTAEIFRSYGLKVKIGG